MRDGDGGWEILFYIFYPQYIYKYMRIFVTSTYYLIFVSRPFDTEGITGRYAFYFQVVFGVKTFDIIDSKTFKKWRIVSESGIAK